MDGHLQCGFARLLPKSKSAEERVGVVARSTSGRTDASTNEPCPDRLRPWADPCQASQERLAISSPAEPRRASGAAPAQTRPGTIVAVRVHVRARGTLYD